MLRFIFGGWVLVLFGLQAAVAEQEDCTPGKDLSYLCGLLNAEDLFLARIEAIEEDQETIPSDHDGPETEAMMRSVGAAFREYVHLNRRISEEVLLSVDNISVIWFCTSWSASV